MSGRTCQQVPHEVWMPKHIEILATILLVFFCYEDACPLRSVRDFKPRRAAPSHHWCHDIMIQPKSPFEKLDRRFMDERRNRSLRCFCTLSWVVMLYASDTPYLSAFVGWGWNGDKKFLAFFLGTEMAGNVEKTRNFQQRHHDHQGLGHVCPHNQRYCACMYLTETFTGLLRESRPIHLSP